MKTPLQRVVDADEKEEKNNTAMKKKFKVLATGFEKHFLYRLEAQIPSEMAGIDGTIRYQPKHSVFKPVHFKTFSVPFW